MTDTTTDAITTTDEPGSSWLRTLRIPTQEEADRARDAIEAVLKARDVFFADVERDDQSEATVTILVDLYAWQIAVSMNELGVGIAVCRRRWSDEPRDEWVSLGPDDLELLAAMRDAVIATRAVTA